MIDVSANMAEKWFDRVGNFHSGQMDVTGRWTHTSSDHLHYEATIDDPEVFTET